MSSFSKYIILCIFVSLFIYIKKNNNSIHLNEHQQETWNTSSSFIMYSDLKITFIIIIIMQLLVVNVTMNRHF